MMPTFPPQLHPQPTPPTPQPRGASKRACSVYASKSHLAVVRHMAPPAHPSHATLQEDPRKLSTFSKFDWLIQLSYPPTMAQTLASSTAASPADSRNSPMVEDSRERDAANVAVPFAALLSASSCSMRRREFQERLMSAARSQQAAWLGKRAAKKSLTSAAAPLTAPSTAPPTAPPPTRRGAPSRATRVSPPKNTNGPQNSPSAQLAVIASRSTRGSPRAIVVAPSATAPTAVSAGATAPAAAHTDSAGQPTEWHPDFPIEEVLLPPALPLPPLPTTAVITAPTLAPIVGTAEKLSDEAPAVAALVAQTADVKAIVLSGLPSSRLSSLPLRLSLHPLNCPSYNCSPLDILQSAPTSLLSGMRAVYPPYNTPARRYPWVVRG